MKNVWVGTDWHVWSSEHTKHHPYQSASNIRQLSDSYANDIQVDDIFIYLGDLCDPAVTDLNELKHLVQNIPGRKILCKGNHDIETDSFYREIGFDDVCDVCVINQVAFSHFPLKVDPDMINVHGHLHSEKRSDVDDANHINAYREDYYKHPIEISELIQSAYDKWLKDSIVHKAVELSDAKTGKVYETSRVLYLTDIFEDDAMNEDTNDAAIVGQLATIDTEDRLLKWVRQNIHLGPMGKIKADIDMVRTHSGSDFDLAIFVHPRLRKLGHFPKLLLFITWEKQNPRPGFVHLMNYWQEMDDSVTWFEVSWRGHEGIHEFDSLDEMKNEILEYYKDTPDAQKYTEAVFRVVPYSYIKIGDNPQDILKKVFEDSGLMDEAVYDFDAYRQKLGTKKIGDVPYDIHKLSTLTKDLLDADILITPESINKARIQEARNCEDLVSYYMDRITNYYKDETGYLAGIEVLSNLVDAGLTSEPKRIQDFSSIWNNFIPTGLSDSEFRDYVNSRMNELDLMESMFQSCILENLELFGIARSEVAMLQKDPANKEQMKKMREQFKKNKSKLITTLPDGTVVFSYPRKNFGKVYITKEIYNNPAAKDILTPYRYFSRASQYDYIIISHRTSDSTPDNWKMLPVTIDGYKEPFTSPKKLVAALGKKSRILLNVCNSDGVMLDGYDNVTYSSSKTILESAVLKQQNLDTTMNTKIKTITATQKALKKLQSKIADRIYDRTLVLTPVNSYYAIGITDNYLPSIKQINFNKYDTVQDGYIVFINQIIDQYRDFLEKMKSILDIFVRYYTGTLSETGYQWFGSSTMSLGSVYGVNYNRIGRYLPSVRDCIQEAVDSTWYDEYNHSGIYIVNESGKEQYVELPSDISTAFALDESLSNVHSDHCKIMVNDQEYKDDGLVSCLDWFCDTVQLGSQVINIKTTDRIRNLWAITEQNSSPLGGRGVDYSYVIQLDMVPVNIDKFSLMKFVCLFDILVTTADQRTIEAGCPNSLCAAIAYWYSQPYYDQLFELPEKSMHPSEEVQKYFNMIQCYQRTINDTAVDLLVRDLFWNKEIDPKILISSALKNSMIACSVDNESALSGYEQLLSMEESVKKDKEELNEILMEPEDAHLFMSDDHSGEKSQKPYKARLSTDDEGVMAEAVIYDMEKYHKLTNRINPKPTKLTEKKYTTLVDDLLDANIKVNPETIDRAALEQVHNANDLVAYYSKRLSDYTTHENGKYLGSAHLLDILLYNLDNSKINVWDNFIPTGLSEQEFAQYMKARFEELDYIEEMFQTVILNNILANKLALADVAASSNKISLYKEFVDGPESDVISCYSDGTRVYTYDKKMGKVFVQKSIFEDKVQYQFVKPSRLFGKAAYYDYIIISHGISNPGTPMWEIEPITVNNKRFYTVHELVDYLGTKPKILILICNADGKVLSKKYDNVTYATTDVLAEDAIPDHNRIHSIITDKMISIVATQKYLKKLKKSIQKWFTAHQVNGTPKNSYGYLGILPVKENNIRRLRIKLFELRFDDKNNTFTDIYTIVTGVIDNYLDMLDRARVVFNSMDKIYFDSMSESGYYWTYNDPSDLNVYKYSYQNPMVRGIVFNTMEECIDDARMYSGFVNESSNTINIIKADRGHTLPGEYETINESTKITYGESVGPVNIILDEDAYQLQGIDRQQQDVISKKYGIRAVGHETDEEREYWEKKEKEEKERKKLAEKKKKDKQLANARKAKKKYAKKREWEAKKAELKSKFDKKNEDVDISDIPYNTGETNFFGKTGSCFDFENETGYQFEMIDKIKFFDRINESSTDNTLYPVYVLCVHTGTLLANAIKKVTNSHFSHCTISFDSSLKNMYSFGRKVKMTELSNGSFVKESIKNPPYTNEGVTYALYCIPVTVDQIAAMKKRLEYFVKNKTKFRYDFGGLIKNYFGIADNPEQSWFCSRFVADIINAGSEPGKPMIREPSLMRPEDFLYTNFAQYITSGLIKEYDPVLVDKITTKLLRIESIKRAKQRALQKPELAMAESCILDLNPYDVLGEAVFDYQMATMDEAAVDKFFLYLKSFKVRFDKDGNVIIHRREVDQLDKYFREANSLLKANMKAGNEQGVVDQLCRVYYMIALINNHYLNSTTKQNTNVKADLKKELIDLRSVMMNVFQQYLKWVTDRNPQFNFQVAYDRSKYSDTVNIPNKIISDIGKTLITAL